MGDDMSYYKMLMAFAKKGENSPTDSPAPPMPSPEIRPEQESRHIEHSSPAANLQPSDFDFMKPPQKKSESVTQRNPRKKNIFQ